MILSKHKCKIIATILAKNEADIIQTTIEHHLNHGVSGIIFTDNNSTDDTLKIAQKYKEVIEIIEEKEEDHNQSKWVTRMAHLAVKHHPDWIVHLDADELWFGLQNLRGFTSSEIGSINVFIHPPVNEVFSLNNFKHYLDFSGYPLDQECKVAHRPDDNIVITHGNHGIQNRKLTFTNQIWRHHYPIRSFDQFVRKAEGHLSLLKRNAICQRWEKWFNLHQSGELQKTYDAICATWETVIKNPNHNDLMKLIKFWSEENIVNYFDNSVQLPLIRVWH